MVMPIYMFLVLFSACFSEGVAGPRKGKGTIIATMGIMRLVHCSTNTGVTTCPLRFSRRLAAVFLLLDVAVLARPPCKFTHNRRFWPPGGG
jgi:hypothetical protein